MVPFVDVLIVAVLIGLNASQFVFAPGMNIALPRSGSTIITNVPTSTVLTLKREDMILFKDGPYSFEALKNALPRYVAENGLEGSILLIKAGRDVSSQRLLDVASLASEAGFGSVQLAADMPLQGTQPGFGPSGF